MELVAAIVLAGAFAALVAGERLAPGRGRWRGWRRTLGGLPWLAATGALLIVVPARLAPLGSAAELDRRVGLALGVVAGVVLADLASYATHRLRHTIPTLWRWHRLHHSAELVDVAGASFVHPFDLAIDLAGVAAATLALGLSADAAILVGAASWVLALFQHADLATPHRLGWIVQRPEAHAIHHARGLHAYNYGKLMLWDIVLGTFRNPAKFSPGPAGFWDGASRRLALLLAGRDVGERSDDA